MLQQRITVAFWYSDAVVSASNFQLHWPFTKNYKKNKIVKKYFFLIFVTFENRKMLAIKQQQHRLQLNSFKNAAQHLSEWQLSHCCHLATNYLKGYCRLKRHGVNNSKTLCWLTLTLILWSGGIWHRQSQHATLAFDIGKWNIVVVNIWTFFIMPGNFFVELAANWHSQSFGKICKQIGKIFCFFLFG